MKLYNVTDLNKIVTWITHTKLIALLADSGIHPVHETAGEGKRVRRLYDDAALTMCMALRKQRDEPQAAKQPEPANATNALLVSMAAELAHVRRQIDQLVKDLGGPNAGFDDAIAGSGGTD